MPVTNLEKQTPPTQGQIIKHTRRWCCITRGLMASLTVNSLRELMILLIVCTLTVPLDSSGGLCYSRWNIFCNSEWWFWELGTVCASYNDVDKVCPGQPGAQRPNNQHAAFEFRSQTKHFIFLYHLRFYTFEEGGGGEVSKPKASVSDGQNCCLSWNVLTC